MSALSTEDELPMSDDERERTLHTDTGKTRPARSVKHREQLASKDLLWRLRNERQGMDGAPLWSTCMEAADEIERLRAALLEIEQDDYRADADEQVYVLRRIAREALEASEVTPPTQGGPIATTLTSPPSDEDGAGSQSGRPADVASQEQKP